MLLKKNELAQIKAGNVSLVFRRWRRPTVKTGSTLKTAVGVLAIDQVVTVDRSDISEKDARNAGYDSKGSLLAALDSREGSIYRIQVRYTGPDPRIALREDDNLSDADFAEMHARLRRFDSASSAGAWTQKVMLSIQRHPQLPAGELAKLTGLEKPRLKVNVRKLKNLGLTISHELGYELSPRGRAVLERLEKPA